MQAGCLNKVVEFYFPQEIQDTYGATVKDYTFDFKTKAHIKYLSGSRTIDSKEIFFSSKVSFTVRKQHNVTEKHRIKYKDKYYTIDYITESDLGNISIIADITNE